MVLTSIGVSSSLDKCFFYVILVPNFNLLLAKVTMFTFRLWLTTPRSLLQTHFCVSLASVCLIWCSSTGRAEKESKISQPQNKVVHHEKVLERDAKTFLSWWILRIWSVRLALMLDAWGQYGQEYGLTARCVAKCRFKCQWRLKPRPQTEHSHNPPLWVLVGGLGLVVEVVTSFWRDIQNRFTLFFSFVS